MNNMYGVFESACWQCLTLNGSIFFITLAGIVLYFGASFDNRYAVGKRTYHSQEQGDFDIPLNSIHSEIIRFISNLLTPRQYLMVVRKITQKIKSITKINQRSFVANTIVFFIFYYLIVSAPSAAMVPVNYNVTYDSQSVIALFLMMLTNAIGDVISLKITLKNIRIIHRFYRQKIKPEETGITTVKKNMLFELKLYSITIRDTILAGVVLLLVLFMTSIYFGVSIGEYKFELTQVAFDGAIERLRNFWDTVREPYWFKGNTTSTSNVGLPMLLIYSLTSFVPTILILLMALFWTLILPLRVIYHSSLPKLKKIIISESIVVLLCSIFYSCFSLLLKIPLSSMYTKGA